MRYPSVIDTKAKQALYDTLDQDQGLTMAIHDAIQPYVSKSDWEGNNLKERPIRIILRQHTPKEHDLDTVFNLVKNQKEYTAHA